MSQIVRWAGLASYGKDIGFYSEGYGKVEWAQGESQIYVLKGWSGSHVRSKHAGGRESS